MREKDLDSELYAIIDMYQYSESIDFNLCNAILYNQ